jgi:hypothetical protein
LLPPVGNDDDDGDSDGIVMVIGGQYFNHMSVRKRATIYVPNAMSAMPVAMPRGEKKANMVHRIQA